MGQYRLRSLRERRVKGKWERRSRLLEEVAAALGAGEGVDVDELLSRLRIKAQECWRPEQGKDTGRLEGIPVNPAIEPHASY
ncbi:MAG: hypothetical protein DRJ56_05900 [Thermoprotei archaeon]|nr:MAG: hypothetical protein DRJ56_05900 [Thermoprotei archaeon]